MGLNRVEVVLSPVVDKWIEKVRLESNCSSLNLHFKCTNLAVTQSLNVFYHFFHKNFTITRNIPRKIKLKAKLCYANAWMSELYDINVSTWNLFMRSRIGNFHMDKKIPWIMVFNFRNSFLQYKWTWHFH